MTRIGPYAVVGKLGEGGMGEVYRAHDSRLGRDVAIKVLPPSLANDADYIGRFQREAQVLASLNHPNIAAIYGLEDNAIVMELVEGEELKGPLPLDEGVRIAKQIADALEAAHERGIVHRDLKPANIKITADGTVKVLDFGLAKATEPARTASASAAHSPTLTIHATTAGVILGTAAYMSPEQAAGKPVDRRADIWAFGVVLWETITGRQMFEGETVSHILAAVLTKTVDLDPIPAGPVRDLIARCVDRDVKTRLRDIGEARIALTRPAQPPIRTAQRPWLAWVLAAVFAVAALGLAASQFFRSGATPQHPVRFSLFAPEGTVFSDSPPAVSPDGQSIAFIAATGSLTKIWVRKLSEDAARPFAGTEGALHAFWSPDSRFLGFFANRKLKKVELRSGTVVTLADVRNPRGASWSKRDVIVFAPSPSDALMRVEASGAEPPKPATFGDLGTGGNHRYPHFLPDGRHFLFVSRSADSSKEGAFVGDLDSTQTRRLTGEPRAMLYAPPGWSLFVRERVLVAQRFDASSHRTAGEPITLVHGSDVSIDPLALLASASDSGVLVYYSGGVNRDNRFVLTDDTGKQLSKVGPPGPRWNMRISPDGAFAAEDRYDGPTNTWQLWVNDLRRGTDLRVATGENATNVRRVVWSPDSKSLLYKVATSSRLAIRPVSGSGEEQTLLDVPGIVHASDWSRDGGFIVFEATAPGAAETGANDIWYVPLSGRQPGKPSPFLTTPAHEWNGRLSPDGRWLAFVSDQTGDYQIYVTSFPNKGAFVRVSTNGGTDPVWSSDGTRLFYLADAQVVMQADITRGEAFQHSPPRALFRFVAGAGPRGLGRLDVHPDGKRFLVRSAEETQASARLNVILNWPSLLNQ